MLRRKRKHPIHKNLKPKVRKPVKRTNPERRAKNFARAYGGAYADRIRAMRCCIASVACFGPTQAHHTVTGGASRKADASTLVPLCQFHHNLWHNNGDFRRAYRESLTVLAASLWQSYQGSR